MGEPDPLYVPKPCPQEAKEGCELSVVRWAKKASCHVNRTDTNCFEEAYHDVKTQKECEKIVN